MKETKVTLSLDLTNPKALELFPLIFAYNHVSTEVAHALSAGDMENVMSLQTPLNDLRQDLERRGMLAHFLNLKGIEVQELLEQASRRKETRVSAILTEPMRKRDVVIQHLRQLLHLLSISGLVALALSAFYVALGLTALLLHSVLFIVLAGQYVRQQAYAVVAALRCRLKVNA